MNTDRFKPEYDEYSELQDELRTLKRLRKELLNEGEDAQAVREIERQIRRLKNHRDNLERKIHGMISEFTGKESKPVAKGHFLVAVASSNGKYVNVPLAQATRLYMYALDNGDVSFIEERPVPAEIRKSRDYGKVLRDCQAVLALRIPGPLGKPLLEKGVRPIESPGNMDIMDAINDRLGEITA